MGNYNLSDIQVAYLLDLLEEKAGETEDEGTLNLIQSLFDELEREIGPDFKPFTPFPEV